MSPVCGIFLIHAESRASVWSLKPQLSVQEKCCSPGAASGGGQLQPMGEEFRTSLEEGTGGPGWTAMLARMSIGGGNFNL